MRDFVTKWCLETVPYFLLLSIKEADEKVKTL